MLREMYVMLLVLYYQLSQTQGREVNWGIVSRPGHCVAEKEESHLVPPCTVPH